MHRSMTQSTHHDMKLAIKAKAKELDFDACGMARVKPVDSEAVARYEKWIAEGKNGCMEWTKNYPDIRENPGLLLEGAKTVIVVALNYYPSTFQSDDAAQFAYYAYGRDYHEVLKDRMRKLAAFIKEATGMESRCCVDSAPIRERYWAQQAGVGFIGLNNALILPGRGSFYFLGVLVTQLDMEPDEPCTLTCGNCHACERACPSHALCGGEPVDARKCLSCLTIECHDELPEWVGKVIGKRVYGCDECQKCCPHNRHAKGNTIAEFQPKNELLHLTAEEIVSMEQAEFSRLFSHSAVKRGKLAGLQRNARLILKNSELLPPDKD